MWASIVSMMKEWQSSLYLKVEKMSNNTSYVCHRWSHCLDFPGTSSRNFFAGNFWAQTPSSPPPCVPEILPHYLSVSASWIHMYTYAHKCICLTHTHQNKRNKNNVNDENHVLLFSEDIKSQISRHFRMFWFLNLLEYVFYYKKQCLILSISIVWLLSSIF